MKHVPILGLSLRHTYYADQQCPDFAIEPSAATERLLCKHRLTLRPRPDGVSVVAPVDDDNNMFIPLPADAAAAAIVDDDGHIQLPAGATFEFHLRLRNPEFALFTDLAAITDLRGRIADEQAARRDELVEKRLHLAPYFVNTGPPEDALTLAVRQTSTKPPSGLFATVGIASGAAAPPADSREFVVDFTATTARWAYYCVTDLDPEAGTLSVVDAAGAAPVLFSSAVAAPDAADPIAGQLAEQYPDLRRLRILSNGLVASRSEARKQLELRLDGDRVTGPLPNPKLSANSTVGVTVGGNPIEQASRYHVVKYPNRPSASTGG